MRARLQIAAGVLALLAAPGDSAGQERSLEYPVKAAFLYKFGSFVDWPPGSLAPSDHAVQVCVVGHDPFGNMLDHVVQGQTIDGRPISVRRLSAIGPTSDCQIAYLGGSSEQSVAAAARAVTGAPVLTVADSRSPGVMVQFVLRANRVRFRIDARAAAASGLRISSKLLNLAVEVAK
jgi:hypothetical protein